MLRWQKYGNKNVCYCPTQIGDKTWDSLLEKVGMVKPKNDGRWEYTLFVSKYTNKVLADNVKQGVCGSFEEAKAKVEGNYAA